MVRVVRGGEGWCVGRVRVPAELMLHADCIPPLQGLIPPNYL